MSGRNPNFQLFYALEERTELLQLYGQEVGYGGSYYFKMVHDYMSKEEAETAMLGYMRQDPGWARKFRIVQYWDITPADRMKMVTAAS